MSKRAVLGTFELIVILAVMRTGEQAYGIPIAEEIRVTTGHSMSIGSIYSTLRRLEAKGLVASEIGEPSAMRGGRAKKYFRITAKGAREVRSTQHLLRLMLPKAGGLEGSRA